MKQQGAADVVLRVKTAQLLEQQLRLIHRTQTHVQVGQAFECEEIKTHGGITACGLITRRQVAKVGAQRGAGNRQRVFTHGPGLRQLVAIKVEAVQRNQGRRVAWRSGPGLLQQWQSLKRQMTQQPGLGDQRVNLRAQAPANGTVGKSRQVIVKVQAVGVHDLLPVSVGNHGCRTTTPDGRDLDLGHADLWRGLGTAASAGLLVGVDETQAR